MAVPLLPPKALILSLLGLAWFSTAMLPQPSVAGTAVPNQEKAKDWWAFRKLTPASPPPAVAHAEWQPANLVDHFIHHKLASQGLSPAGDAEKPVLLRRLCLDLTGLPPNPEQLARFLADDRPQAYEAMADELLASRAHAEHQARKWLDLVRYADSDGYRADDFRPQAWRYRDWVVDSFHQDMPYSKFMALQIAGDEMHPEDPAAHIATGYLRQTIYEYNNRDAVGQRLTILNDITDNVSDVFLGLGLQCARCHDHKFDPLLQEDYYRLQAFFVGLNPKLEGHVGTAEQKKQFQAALEAWEASASEVQKEMDALLEPYRAKTQEEAIVRFPPETIQILRRPLAELTPYEAQIHELSWRQIDYDLARISGKVKGSDKERLEALQSKLSALQKDKPAELPKAQTACDVGAEAPPNPVPGKTDTALQNVLPGIPVLFSAKPMDVQPLAQSTGRRQALAKWLGSDDNFLTARVIVNRLWQQHFGRGLVATSSDFGLLGEPPTHPELLDWLAQELIANGWRLKPIHRLLVTSRTWRQAAAPTDPEKIRKVDPQNSLLSHWSVRRLSAEQVRDAMLTATGELDASPGGSPADHQKPRRSLYLKVLRNVQDPVLEAFDAPQHINSSPERHTTTTPLQSLLLSNHSWMLQRSQAMAKRLIAATPSPVQQIALASELIWNRPPTEDELAAGLHFLTQQQQEVKRDQAALTATAEHNIPRELMPQRSGKAAVFRTTNSAKENSSTALSTTLVAPESVTQALKNTLTVETVVLSSSVYPNGDVRVALSTWDGNKAHGGWALGLTGMGSQRKSHTPVLQLCGKDPQGNPLYQPLFCDYQIQLERSYYLAATITPATAAAPGLVTFLLKDLANEDEPLRISSIPHGIATWEHSQPLTIGARSAKTSGHAWDGLIDEIRLYAGLLDAEKSPEQLLFNQPLEKTATAAPPNNGQWQPLARYTWDAAEPQHALAESIAAHGPLRPTRPADTVSPEVVALADFCQAMLASSEFLYLE